jgi:hypothetical protein
MMSTTLLSESRSAVTRPPFTIGRKTGPSVILAAASQALMDLIGPATSPGTMAMTAPCPSWSVFDRAIRMQSPPSVSSRSSTFSATSSERRSAAAKPNRSSARSRSPASVSGAAVKRKCKQRDDGVAFEMPHCLQLLPNFLDRSHMLQRDFGLGLLTCAPSFLREPGKPVPPTKRVLEKTVDLWSAVSSKQTIDPSAIEDLAAIVTRAVTDLARIASPADLAKILARQAMPSEMKRLISRCAEQRRCGVVHTAHALMCPQRLRCLGGALSNSAGSTFSALASRPTILRLA